MSVIRAVRVLGQFRVIFTVWSIFTLAAFSIVALVGTTRFVH